MPRALSIFLSALFTVAVCWSTGKLVLDRLRVTLYREEEHFFRFVVGGACFSMLVFCLTAASLAREGVFLVVGASLIAAAWSLPRRVPRVPLPDFALRWKAAFWAAFVAYGVYYFVFALAPESSPDGATYHLGVVSRYYRWHSFGHITTQMYASLSQGLEMLFLFAFAFGRHSAAALMEFSFLLALPWGILSYGRRFGFPKAGVFAAVLVFASPVFGISGSVAYNDAAGACVIFAAFYLLQIWRKTGEAALLVPTGLMAGFAYGIKYTLFLAVPYAGGVVLWHLFRTGRPLLRPAAIFAICAVSMMAPWWVKNWVVVGNPFSPFLNSYFPNPHVTIGFEKIYVNIMSRLDGISLWQRATEQTALGGKTGGFVGPVFLLAPLGLLALRYAAGRQVLLAAAVFVVPAFTNWQTRFLMPCLPFVSLALGLALMEARAALSLLLIFDTITCWPGFTANYSTGYAWRIDRFPVAEAMRRIPEIETIRKRVGWIREAEFLEQNVPPDGLILSLGDLPEAYMSRRVMVGYESAEAQKMTDILFTAFLNERKPSQLLTFAFPPRDLRRVRVVQTAKSAEEFWSVSEFRLYSKGGELRRSPLWQITARPNRFDVPLAFDNDPVTRWSSEEIAQPGMKIEVDLGGSQRVDEVILEAAADQGPVKVTLEGQQAEGRWRTLAERPTVTTRESAWDLRRAATAELRARGITHLVVSKDNAGAADFARNVKKWSFELLMAFPEANIYRLEP